MADLFSTNRNLFIKRYEHQKTVAMANIQAREIRIMELEEEIQRCRMDIDAQHNVIADMDNNIRLQIEEMEKDKEST